MKLQPVIVSSSSSLVLLQLLLITIFTQQLVQVVSLFHRTTNRVFNKVAPSHVRGIYLDALTASILRYYVTIHVKQQVPVQSEWSVGKVLQNTRNAEGLRLIDIEVPESVSSTYIHPGQYVKLKAGDTKPAFLAIASAPSKGNIFSFLIKETASNGYITTAKEGELFDLSVALGKGFQIKEYFDNYKNDFPVNNILLMACGSGLAPIAAAIESGNLGLRETGYTTIFERKAVLYIGARTPEHLPFANKYPAWEKQGIRIVPVISQPTAKWNGRTGYIQDALREDLVPVPKNTAALLCGVRDMQDNVKELLLESGVFEGRILLNF